MYPRFLFAPIGKLECSSVSRRCKEDNELVFDIIKKIRYTNIFFILSMCLAPINVEMDFPEYACVNSNEIKEIKEKD